MDIADPKTLFKELLSPLDVGGELVFDDEMLDQTLHSDQASFSMIDGDRGDVIQDSLNFL